MGMLHSLQVVGVHNLKTGGLFVPHGNFYCMNKGTSVPLHIVYKQKKNSEFGTIQTCFRPKDSQLLAQSLISCLAVVVHIQKQYPGGRGKNFGPKTSDLSHIQFLCGTSPC
jgi:hypothetical protein